MVHAKNNQWYEVDYVINNTPTLLVQYFDKSSVHFMFSSNPITYHV
jgi:hypothetical protein